MLFHITNRGGKTGAHFQQRARRQSLLRLRLRFWLLSRRLLQFAAREHNLTNF